MIIHKNENFRFKLCGKTLVIIDWANVYGWFETLKWEIDPKKLFTYLSAYSEIYDKRLYHGVEVGNYKSEKFKQNVETIGFVHTSKEVKWVPVSLNRSHFKKIIKELFDVLDSIKKANSDIATMLNELKNKIEKQLSVSSESGSVYSLIEELDIELKNLNLNIDDLQKHLSEPVMRRKCDFDVEIARDVFNTSCIFSQLILFSGDGDYAALVDDLISKGKKVILVFAPEHKGREYIQKKGLFLCTINNLKPYIFSGTNIPTDFSVGRDSSMVTDDTENSQIPTV